MRPVRRERSAVADLRRLRRIDPDAARSLGAAVDHFARTGQGDVRGLPGATGLWRLHTGRWRVLFTEEDAAIVVLGVLPGPVSDTP